MRRTIIALVLILAFAFTAPAAADNGSPKRVTIGPPKHPHVTTTTAPTTTVPTTTSTSTTSTTTSTTTTTRPTTTTVAPAPVFTATLVAFSATTTPVGTHYVVATLSWSGAPVGASLMVCALNVTANGGSCIGLGVPATSTYTTSPDLVGEIPGGTTLEYKVRACNGACIDSNLLTVIVS